MNTQPDSEVRIVNAAISRIPTKYTPTVELVEDWFEFNILGKHEAKR